MNFDPFNPFGKGGSKKKKTNFADIQGQLAQRLFDQTDPLRSALIGRSEDFLSGGFDPTQTPAYQDLQLQTGRNFNQAKDNIIARFAPGGGLIDAITGLEGDRAATLSGGASQIYQSELDRALSLGTGATGLALGSIGQAGNIQAMKSQAAAERDSAKAQGTGAAVGSFAGAK